MAEPKAGKVNVYIVIDITHQPVKVLYIKGTDQPIVKRDWKTVFVCSLDEKPRFHGEFARGVMATWQPAVEYGFVGNR